MVLLDTCTLLWLAMAQDRLSRPARTALEEAGEFAYVSAISAWEIAWKHRHGKLGLRMPPADWFARALANHELREIGISAAIALRMAALPEIHRDPADRFLIATALEHRLTLVSPDPLIRQYPEVTVIW